jgi:hypothetical protein
MTAPNYDPLLVPAMTAADQPQPDERMHATNSFICGTGGCLMVEASAVAVANWLDLLDRADPAVTPRGRRSPHRSPEPAC